MNISIETLVACGFTPSNAESFARRLQRLSSTQDVLARWKTLTHDFLTPDVPFAVHELLYSHNYATYRQNQYPCPAWIPEADAIQTTHLAKWMNALGVQTYEELHDWSVNNREEFTKRITETLAIRFSRKPTRFCDISSGVENVHWYANGTMNIAESCFQGDKDAIAMIVGDDTNRLQQITYASLQASTAQVANGLKEFGIKPGDRVAISMPMTAHAIAIFLGIIAAGCAVVTIADSFSSAEMAIRLEITQPKCMFIQDEIVRDGKVFPSYDKIISQKSMRVILLRAGESQEIKLRTGDLEWKEFLSDDCTLKCVPRNPDDETTILFSSGTTGHPKAIPWNHVTPVKSACDAYFHHDVHSGDILCWPTNLGWMMGPWLVYAALINKATIAITSATPTSRTFCEFVQQAGVTMLGLVPSLVSVWRQRDWSADLDWRSLRLFSSTGECSNAKDMLWLMSRAGYRPVIEYCGGTETGGGYITGTLTKPSVPGMFSAKAMGFAWLLLNAESEKSSMGEVFFEPPAIGLSTRLLNRDHHEVYFAGIPPGPDGQVLRRHGDQIEELTGGYFRAHGRMDDAMNLAGVKVSSVQIEELLNQHEALQEVAAISVPPSEGGPGLLIIFAVHDGEIDMQELRNELQQIIKTQLNPIFKIHSVESIDKLPRTASNKVMRRRLRERYIEKYQS